MKIMLAYFAQFVNRSGGMEKICCELANAMVQRGNIVSILYYSDKEGRPFYPLDQRVQMVNLMDEIREKNWETSKIYMPFSAKLIRELLRIVNKRAKSNWNEKWKTQFLKQPCGDILEKVSPEIAISFDLKTSNILLSVHDFHIKSIITMFHFDPNTVLKTASSNEIEAINKSTFVQVLTPSYKNYVESLFPNSRVVCIPNPVSQYRIKADLSVEKKFHKIINVARLYKKQKRQHILIQAFAQLADEYPNWNLEFWGEEQNRKKYKYTDELLNYISDHQLENRVLLKGTTQNILQLYLNSDIFCLPSAYEGFCLALTEAMSAGLPIVAFKSCPSIKDIIVDGQTGLLADDDVDSLANKLRVLMDDSELRQRLGINAHREMEKFAADKIWQQWDKIIKMGSV